jgi:RNA polymerase sigma-70 factor (ECF subfamily)
MGEMNIDPDIDQITIKRASKGDTKAFARVYETYAEFVWKVIFRTVNGDYNDASEIFQQVFIRTYKSIGSFQFNSRFSTWIYRIAFNACRTYLTERKKRWERMMEFPENFPGPVPEPAIDAQRQVARILESLSPEERFLLSGRELSGMSYEQLAEITGKNPGALRTQVHRIKDAIKTSFTLEKAVVA